jgi:hypothetical protein
MPAMKQVLVPGLLVAMLLAACSGRAPETRTPAASPSAETATATAPAPRTTTGLFTEPRETHVDEYRSLGPKPNTFAAWNGASTMLYDIGAGTAIDLGPGTPGRFSPDGTRMVWITGPTGDFADGEAWMIDLRTMERRGLGPGRLVGFVDDGHVGVTRPGTNATDVIDLGTGAPTVVAGIPFNTNFNNVTTPDGYDLRRTGLYADEENGVSLIDPRTGATLLQFKASLAIPAGHGTLAVTTLPAPVGEPNPNGYRHGTTNIFLVDIATGEATFVATGGVFVQFALAANDTYVVWTDNYCDGGKSRLYDRRARTITEIDASLWPVFTRDGLIVDGPFGGQSLIDPKTLRYVAALPGGEPSWSPDHRHASIGQVGGHGGPCL